MAMKDESLRKLAEEFLETVERDGDGMSWWRKLTLAQGDRLKLIKSIREIERENLYEE